jgi:nitrogen fixation/metabolism regulation signal transduction histidine kinase
VGYLMRADLYFVVAYVLLFSLVLGLNVVNLLLARHDDEGAAKLDLQLHYFFLIGTVLAYTILTMSAFFWK